MKKAYIYSKSFSDFSYGSGHPMRPARLGLTFDLSRSLDLFDAPEISLVEARRATNEEIIPAHTSDYLNALMAADNGETPPRGDEFGLGYGDNPVFKGVYEWSTFSTGASIQAVKQILSGDADIAFNIAGGLHHAMASRASGFCYLNDAVVAINHLVDGGKRVAYVDIDAHHGDGVERAFYGDDRVLTISLHESGHFLFPGTGFPEEMGSGAGHGFAVNLPFMPETGDDIFVESFNAIVPRFLEAFAPDVLVTQLGVDTMASDPITHMALTTDGFERMVRSFKGFGLPWVALGGGGYDLSNVARAWTLAWAIMAGREVSDSLDEPLVSGLLEEPITRLRDVTPERTKISFPALSGSGPELPKKDIEFLIDKVLPLVREG